MILWSLIFARVMNRSSFHSHEDVVATGNVELLNDGMPVKQ